MQALVTSRRAVELVVLDVVGTTLIDSGEVKASFDRALQDFGLDATDGQLAPLRGLAKPEAIKRLVGMNSEISVAQVHDRFVEHLRQHYQTNGSLAVDGARVALSALRESGVRVALNTGLDRVTTLLAFEAQSWCIPLIDALICAEDVSAGRPAPDMIHAAMFATGIDDSGRVMNVGDTSADLLAGAAARVALNVGVLTGAHDRACLTAHPHTHIVGSICEIPELCGR